MGDFWKAAAAVLLACILGLVLDRQEKDFSALLTIGVCVLSGGVALSYLAPVLDFLEELEGLVQGEFLGILLKAVGVGAASELIGMICNDAGKGSLGKSLQMLGSAVMLSLALPIFRTILAVIRQILGGL